MTVYTGVLDTDSLKYVSSNIPVSLGEDSLILSDVSVGTQIDVSHFLGRKAKKVLVSFNNITSSSSAVLLFNSVQRVLAFNETGSDYVLRNWNPIKGYSIVASRPSVGTWSSFSGYGDLEIDSIEVTTTTLNGVGATMDIIIIC